MIDLLDPLFAGFLRLAIANTRMEENLVPTVPWCEIPRLSAVTQTRNRSVLLSNSSDKCKTEYPKLQSATFFL